MLRLIVSIVFLCISASICAQNKENEKAVKAYYTGFENKNWNAIASQLAEGFSFTSPNNDDHLSIAQFKNKCWGTSQFFKKVNLIKMFEQGDELMPQVEIITTDNKVVRNVDVFSFSNNGKIKSIEVFFGASTKYPGNKG